MTENQAGSEFYSILGEKTRVANYPIFRTRAANCPVFSTSIRLIQFIFSLRIDENCCFPLNEFQVKA